MQICLYAIDDTDKLLKQACDILTTHADFKSISFTDFMAEKDNVCELKIENFNKLTLFFSAHAEPDFFEFKNGKAMVTVNNFFLKIEKFAKNKNSELVIFDAACHSFEHIHGPEKKIKQDYFAKDYFSNAVYIGGACSGAMHAGTIMKNSRLLIYQNLMEPILQKWEYQYDSHKQTFLEFKTSITKVKLFTDLENLQSTSCTKHNHGSCSHYQVSILHNGIDYNVKDWFSQEEEKTKFFLQFPGYFIFKDFKIKSMGYAINVQTPEEEILLRNTTFNPKTEQIITFEIVDLDSAWDVLDTISLRGDSFHELMSNDVTNFPHKFWYFTKNITKREIPVRSTLLFRVYL